MRLTISLLVLFLFGGMGQAQVFREQFLRNTRAQIGSMHEVQTLSLGGTTFKGFEGFGSEEIALRYALKRSEVMSVAVVLYIPGYGYHTVLHRVAKANNLSLSTLNNSFRSVLNDVAAFALTDPDVKGDSVLEVYASTVPLKDPGAYDITFFESSFKFSLVRVGNTYALPSFDSQVMNLASVQVYPIPDLGWARVVAEDTIVDSRDADSEGIVSSEGVKVDIVNKTLLVDTGVATSGNVRISLVTTSTKVTKFQCYGALGTPVPETPFRLKFNRYPKDIPKGIYADDLEIVGGEVGRTLTLCRAKDAKGPWLPVSSLKLVIPSYGSIRIPVGAENWASLNSVEQKSSLKDLSSVLTTDFLYCLEAIDEVPYQK